MMVDSFPGSLSCLTASILIVFLEIALLNLNLSSGKGGSRCRQLLPVLLLMRMGTAPVSQDGQSHQCQWSILSRYWNCQTILVRKTWFENTAQAFASFSFALSWSSDWFLNTATDAVSRRCVTAFLIFAAFGKTDGFQYLLGIAFALDFVPDPPTPIHFPRSFSMENINERCLEDPWTSCIALNNEPLGTWLVLRAGVLRCMTSNEESLLTVYAQLFYSQMSWDYLYEPLFLFFWRGTLSSIVQGQILKWTWLTRGLSEWKGFWVEDIAIFSCIQTI